MRRFNKRASATLYCNFVDNSQHKIEIIGSQFIPVKSRIKIAHIYTLKKCYGKQPEQQVICACLRLMECNIAYTQVHATKLCMDQDKLMYHCSMYHKVEGQRRSGELEDFCHTTINPRLGQTFEPMRVFPSCRVTSFTAHIEQCHLRVQQVIR